MLNLRDEIKQKILIAAICRYCCTYRREISKYLQESPYAFIKKQKIRIGRISKQNYQMNLKWQTK